MIEGMPTSEIRALPVTVDLATAARALRLGQTMAYTLAKRDEFPCRLFRQGGRYVVARGDILRALGIPETADRRPAATRASQP